jgi:hypothetical protein
MEGKPTVNQTPYRGRKILISTLSVAEEDFKAELKLISEVFLRSHKTAKAGIAKVHK